MAGGDRSGADAALIAALAGGSTVEDAATTAGIGVTTAYRRLKDAGFRKQVDAYASNVQGLEPSKYLPLGQYKFNKVSV